MQQQPPKRVRRQIFVALGLILNERNEILLGKRHDPRNRGMHGRWEFPGGKVEFGEHPAQTVVREVKEEVGIDVTVERLLNVYSWFHPDRPHIQVVLIAYIARALPDQHPRANCTEIREVAWKTIDDAINSQVVENNKTIFNELKKAL